MIQVKTIACYVDFSGLASDLIAAGVGLAHRFGARLLAVAVVPPPGIRPPGYLLPDDMGALYELDYAEAAQQLEELVQATPHRGVQVEACTVSGDASKALISLLAREQADLMLVCSPPSRPLLAPMNRLHEYLFRHAPCPVLNINSAAIARQVSGDFELAAPADAAQAWPASARSRRPSLVVATRLEPPSESAVLTAIVLARYYEAELTILHVCEARSKSAEEKFGFWQFLANFSTESQELLSSIVCPEWLKPQPKMVTIEGHRDKGILETAGHLSTDLLIVGARRPPLGTPLWPSLASRLASAAPCPVLVSGKAALNSILPRLQSTSTLFATAS